MRRRGAQLFADGRAAGERIRDFAKRRLDGPFVQGDRDGAVGRVRF